MEWTREEQEVCQQCGRDTGMCSCIQEAAKKTQEEREKTQEEEGK